MQASADVAPRDWRTGLWPGSVTWCILCLCAGLVFFGNLRFGPDAIGAGYEDDFYYYAQAARNLALHGMSTFDGVHRTNGYHPLWFLVLTALSWLFAPGGLLRASSTTAFVVALESVQFVLALSTAYLAYRVARLRCDRAISHCAQLCIFSTSLILIRTGMESGLTLALALLLLLFRLRGTFQWSRSNSLLYGLLASAMVLSRLDSMLFVLLLLLFDGLPLIRTSARQNLVWICVGLSPLAVYFWSNKVLFGTLLPVSGTAKQLRLHHTPSPAALLSFAQQLFAFKAPLYTLYVLGSVLAVLSLLRHRRADGSGRRGVLFAALLFAFVHLAAIVCLSDWSIWQWYLYAWPVAGMAALLVLAPTQQVRVAGTVRRWEYAALVFCSSFVLAYSALLVKTTSPSHHLTYVAAKELVAFAATHPGTYAMGDRSGAVGYLLPDPVIQLEGLMMDKAYLQNIRSQRNLLDVLHGYGVRYYIASRSRPEANGCYAFREPAQAGTDSPAMHGYLCKQPLLVLRHGDFTNEVFDLASASGPSK